MDTDLIYSLCIHRFTRVFKSWPSIPIFHWANIKYLAKQHLSRYKRIKLQLILMLKIMMIIVLILGSIILEPRPQYNGAPHINKTCFWFNFQIWNLVNKRFPVHLLDHHVAHKTWFYQNFPSSILSRILTIIFRGSHVPDWQFLFSLIKSRGQCHLILDNMHKICGENSRQFTIREA